MRSAAASIDTDVETASALDLLAVACTDAAPLAALDPAEYAAGHALFEARSEQRGRLTDWLVGRLGTRADGPTRVLSIGCGDGTVDERVAGVLASHGQPVTYVGVEPHGPSGRTFAARLGAVDGVRVAVLTDPFAAVDPAGPFDVILAVHSLYYVDDLAATLRRAVGLLAPGGELVVLHAPVEPLNLLVRLLAPGRRQGFSAEVLGALDTLELRAQVTRIDSRLDLSETGDAATDRRLLEFTVQAGLSPELQRLVRTALAEQALPGPGLVVAHPVDALVVQA